ncbi:hypothetical protein BDR06DRAFT_981588 [Suillus hirtellus]|nr:hypothetical protein BDR06DRAFT_981588 [Suillus hirtellus]
MNYYSKIWRLTSSIFPLMVLDHYRELMRTARQWHQCKLYKWHGFAHQNDEPKTSDLALFCLACPQLGINLDWTLVMDGNFKDEHLHPVNPSNESHLAVAQDHVQKSDCNNHHALEATGIGGCACARHGCFVPHSMVDFQKGER